VEGTSGTIYGASYFCSLIGTDLGRRSDGAALE
jgi:hypothetical protein